MNSPPAKGGQRVSEASCPLTLWNSRAGERSGDDSKAGGQEEGGEELPAFYAPETLHLLVAVASWPGASRQSADPLLVTAHSLGEVLAFWAVLCLHPRGSMGPGSEAVARSLSAQRPHFRMMW